MRKDEIFSTSLLESINNRSDLIDDRNDYINELFLYFIIPLYEKLYQLDFKNKKEMLLLQVDKWFFFLLNHEGKESNKLTSLLMNTLRAVFSLIGSIFACFFYFTFLPVYILVKFKYKETLSDIDEVAIIRSPATFSKMIFLEEEGVTFFFDSLVYKDCEDKLSLYSTTFFERFLGALWIPFLGIRDLIDVFFSSRKHLGFFGTVKILEYYKKRIAHKVVFEFYFNRLLKRINPKCLYTGNKEDRFALIEKRVCERLKVKVICIPHGLEYSFKMPNGLVGDIFYCNSQYAKDYLSNLYVNHKIDFFFDEHVVKKMLSKQVAKEKIKKVVFFPESREPGKNLAIIKFLKEQEIEFSIKLHGKDSFENYTSFIDETMLVESFDVAISNSICLARKSTVLIEAIYNNSIPVAVLIDDKDRDYFEFMFPSLNDKSIRKVYSYEGLEGLIRKLRDGDVSK